MEVFLLLVLALLSPDALACDCESGPWNVLPERDATGVPTSAVVVVQDVWHDPADLAVTLVDADGNEVPLTSEDVVAGNAFTRVLRPTAPLAPEATYTVRSTVQEGTQTSSFTTGTEADTTAPAAATLGPLYTDHDPESSCGPQLNLGAELSTSATEPVVYEIQADTTDAFADPERMFSTWERLQWGAGACSDTHPGLDFDQTWCFRVRTMDGSGNTSDWSASSCLEVGEDIGVDDTDADTDDTAWDSGEDDLSGGCGCNGSAASASWAGLLALVGLRRGRGDRRRTPPRSR